MQTKMRTKDPIFKLSLNFAIIGLNKKSSKKNADDAKQTKLL